MQGRSVMNTGTVFLVNSINSGLFTKFIEQYNTHHMNTRQGSLEACLTILNVPDFVQQFEILEARNSKPKTIALRHTQLGAAYRIIQ